MKKEQDSMSLYDQIVAGDILTPIIEHLKRGRFCLHKDGRVTEDMRLAFERPWLTAVVDYERNCSRWLHIYFQIYKIIPKGCRNCWKIAFRPKTLEDAFAVLKLQESMGVRAKTGLERRGRTGNKGGYSSFWYASLTDGLKRARDIFRTVESALYSTLKYTDGLILKRGCTEMEQFSSEIFGDSTQWDSRAPMFDLSEKLLDAVFDIPEQYHGEMPAIVTNYIKRQWIDWAFEHGDETYLKYTGGKPHTAPLFNYMEPRYLTKQIPLTWEGSNESDSKSSIEPIV